MVVMLLGLSNGHTVKLVPDVSLEPCLREDGQVCVMRVEDVHDRL